MWCLQTHVRRKGQLNMRIALGLLIGFVLLVGCDADRLAKLEKENSDLKARVEKENTALDYDLQSKCAKDSRAWFNQNWNSSSRDKDTMLLDFTNHYNKKSNTCFILVEYHFGSGDGSAWYNNMTLWNVYENQKYADFTEFHQIFAKGGILPTDSVSTCSVSGDKCTSIDQFNNLARPYMND